MTTNIRKLRQTMDQMYLERDQMGDVTFLVDSQRIRAHRIILATQSPKYKAQFYGPHRDEGEIHVPFVTATAFNVFLQFFYKKRVDLTMDNIEIVLDLAKQSLVDDFVETCVNFLKGSIKGNVLCVAYRLTNLYDIESLRLECEQRISTNTMDVFSSDDFLQCDRDSLVQILKMDTLNCTEKDVFAACIAWARAQCKRDSLDDRKPENLRLALGDAIHQVRFSSFNTEEFADLHKATEGLFTAEEVIEILYMIAKLTYFKSQKFNQTARTARIGRDESLEMFDDENIVWALEIDRFVRINDRPYESVEVGRVEFQCNRLIRLYGIALGIRFDKIDLHDLPGTLSIRIGHGLRVNEYSFESNSTKFKMFQSPTKHDETMIMFEQPIERITYFSCDLRLPFKQVNYELLLRPTAQSHGVNFTFHSKWVTRVFCEEVRRIKHSQLRSQLYHH